VHLILVEAAHAASPGAACSACRVLHAERFLELPDAVEQIVLKVFRGLANLRIEVAVYNPLGIAQARAGYVGNALIAEIGESVRRSNSLAI
jgi:hypothetical protein